MLVLGILRCTCAWAQNDTGTSEINPPPAQPGPQPTFSYPDTAMSLDFLTGAVENSSITLGIGAGFAFDSNGYPSGTTNSRQNRWLFNLTPSVSLQQFFPRFAWHAAYSGGLQIYNQITGPSTYNNTLYGQTFSGGFIWQFSRHWQLLANENYRYSADPFQSYITIAGTPTANNPNATSYIPLTNFEQNNAIVTVSNQITKRDVIAFTGTENYRYTSRYNVVTTVTFYNLISYGGRVGYTHQLSARLSLGGGYNFNSLDFGHGQQRSGIQTVEFSGDYLIRPNMSISGWIGPQYTSTKTIVPFPVSGEIFYLTNYSHLWSTALGVSFGWHTRRDAVIASFSRQISDGGGLTATSQVNQFNASYHRQLTRKWSGIVGARYLNSASTTVNGRTFDNYSVNVVADYLLAKRCSINASYIRVHQTQSNLFVLNPGTYNDNRVGVNISYSWSHPLGR
jgi:hypothetical protein